MLDVVSGRRCAKRATYVERMPDAGRDLKVRKLTVVALLTATFRSEDGSWKSVYDRCYRM